MNRWKAFQFLCSCLSVSPDWERLRRRIGNGEADWSSVFWVASQHFVTPALYWSLHQTPLWEDLPDDVRNYLQAIYSLNRDRNNALRHQLLEMIDTLSPLGVEPVLLKGAISLADALYPDIGIRVMSDLDLMVPPDRLRDCVSALHADGYSQAVPILVEGVFLVRPSGALPTDTAWLARHHYPALLREDRPAAVELHQAPVLPEYSHLLPAEALWHSSRFLDFETRRVRIPSPGHRLLHNFVHAQLVDAGHAKGRVSLRQLREFAALRHQSDLEAEVAALAQALDAGAAREAFEGYVSMCERFLDQPVPAGMRLSKTGESEWMRVRFHLRYPYWGRLSDYWDYACNKAGRILQDPLVLKRLADPIWYVTQRAALRRLRQSR